MFSNKVAFIGGLVTFPVVGCLLFYLPRRRVREDDRIRPLCGLVNKIQEDFKTASQIQIPPSQVLRRLRNAVKAYVAYIPGADYLVEDTFDEMAKLHERLDQREEDSTAIILLALTDILKTQVDAGSWFEIYGICRRLSKDLKMLANGGEFVVRRVYVYDRKDTQSRSSGPTSASGDTTINREKEMKETVESWRI